MRTCVLVGLVVVAWLGDAAAQPIATGPRAPGTPDPDQAEPPAPPHPTGGLGGALTVGRAGMAGSPTGWLVRLDYEIFPVLAPHGDAPGPIVGFHVGWEIWRARPDWGLSLPIAVVLGVRAQPVRATLGFGVDAFLVDVVDDDRGLGLYAPFACARAGLDILGFQLGADARVVRRWQIGAPDHTQWQLGAFVGRTWASKDRRARY